MDTMDLSDLAPAEVPVKIGDKRYVLKDASADAARRYRNALLRSTKLGPDGRPVSIDGMADAEPILVAGCLFEVVRRGDSESLKPVSLQDVHAMGSRVVRKLFDKAKEISDLTEAPDTADELNKMIERLTRKRDELMSGQATGPKDTPGTGTGTSPSQPDSASVSTPSWDGRDR